MLQFPRVGGTVTEGDKLPGAMDPWDRSTRKTAASNQKAKETVAGEGLAGRAQGSQQAGGAGVGGIHGGADDHQRRADDEVIPPGRVPTDPPPHWVAECAPQSPLLGL